MPGNKTENLTVFGYTLEEIHELIEKDTPKKVIKYKPTKYAVARWICPVCEYQPCEMEVDYCPNCGQSLLWTDYIEEIKNWDKDAAEDERQKI